MPLLTVSKATKTFGGVAAVKDVSLTVEEGEILGIMGPNGSGKTTLFNLVSGVFYPDSGDIFFQDERTNKLPPHQLCHRGLARTFQLVRPFLGFTAEENVLVGLGYGRDRLTGSKARDKAGELLDSVGLAGQSNRLANTFTVMDRKRLELARALATAPKLLLLDEFMAGLTPTETSAAIEPHSTIAARRSDRRPGGAYRLGATRYFASHRRAQRRRENRRRRAGNRGKRSARDRSLSRRNELNDLNRSNGLSRSSRSSPLLHPPASPMPWAAEESEGLNGAQRLNDLNG